MDYYNQILSEQLYPYSNLTSKERDFYLNLLLHTKEINNTLCAYTLKFMNI